MARTSEELHPCACGCGELVRGTYKRGHAARMRGRVEPMPPPGSDFSVLAAEAEVFGDIVDIGDATPPASPAPGPPSSPSDLSPEGGGPPGDDEPPAHARQERKRRRLRTHDDIRDAVRRGPDAKPPRLTQAKRADITAKVNFMLEIPGRIWQARDPVCGTAFVDQRPEIADALTEIVCQSADLVEWFTGTGGAFMVWLNLVAAAWPVGTMILAHHVYHSIQVEADGSATGYAPVNPDYSRYAA